MTFPERNAVRIKENSLLARLAAWRMRTTNVAMVIGHTIHLHGVTRNEFLGRKSWLCHELRHVAQFEAFGTIGFLYRYLLETRRHGYRNNRFEVEARASENDDDLLLRYTIQPPPDAV